MQKITLAATSRTESGKGSARSLRRDGSIPAVIYRKGEAQALTLNHKEMITFINKTRGEKALITLNFGDSSKLALMKEYQVDPVMNNLLHADFIEISMDEKVRVPIKIKLMGEAIGVKRDKGILERAIREVEIEALPADVPGHIEVDISELAAEQTLHIRDIEVPEGVTVLNDPAEPIASVSIPKIQEVAVEEGEEEAPGEEAAKAEDASEKPKAE